MSSVSEFVDIVSRRVLGFFRSEPSPEEQIETTIDDLQSKTRDINRSIADLTQSKKQVELQRDRLQNQIRNQEQKARNAIRNGNDSVAESLVQQKVEQENQVETLNQQVADLDDRQSNLVEIHNEVKSEIQQLKAKKTSLTAQRTAAESAVSVNEMKSDIGDKSVDRLLEEYKEDTRDIEARAEALEEYSGGTVSTEASNNTNKVNQELEELKQEELN